MIFGYIRVSTDKQTVENQRFEIKIFCEKNGITVDKWIDETISGSKGIEKRKLGILLGKLKANDVLICTELSRLGRNLLMIMSMLNYCLNNEIEVWTIKEGYRLGNDISSKILAFAFGLSAEIERTLISQRTKEALARKRSEGVVLGRPKGSKSSRLKLSGREEDIYFLLLNNSIVKASKKLGVNRATLSNFLKTDEYNLFLSKWSGQSKKE
ncbi:MAG: master DNA invertase Mpi family serine-type recombinase [Methanomassiliicoccaceae archaeon]|nr:master DNA invertase Mpi family serine-type recombinase [Methanomassiliicoccaceae archaeon]